MKEPTPKIEYNYINNTAELEKKLSVLDKNSALFIDSEFQSENNYYAKPCLIQLADDKNILIIDPISNLSLEPLVSYLKHSKQQKVLHAGDQDLMIFHKMGIKWLKPIFDTQMAAAFLGYGLSISYGDLVKNICKVSIQKNNQSTNWLKRPLYKDQIQYAATDVLYLQKIYKKLYEELEARNRLKWLYDAWDERQQKLINLVDSQQAWKKLRLKTRHRNQLQLIKALANWRETKAKLINIPRQRLISDHALLGLVDAKPRTIQDCERLRFFPKTWLTYDNRNSHYISEILSIVNDKYIEDSIEGGGTSNKYNASNLSGKDSAQLDLLRLLLRDCSRNHDVAASYVANDNDLIKLIYNEQDLRSLKGWRNEVFGIDAKKVLKGNLAVTVSLNGLKWLSI